MKTKYNNYHSKTVLSVFLKSLWLNTTCNHTTRLQLWMDTSLILWDLDTRGSMPIVMTLSSIISKKMVILKRKITCLNAFLKIQVDKEYAIWLHKVWANLTRISCHTRTKSHLYAPLKIATPLLAKSAICESMKSHTLEYASTRAIFAINILQRTTL